MNVRPFTNEEVQMMNEINESVQRLDLIDKAKTVGFIAGLVSHADKEDQVSSINKHFSAKSGAAAV